MRRSLVLHAHCYQPPRADPWYGEIEAEPSAQPFHDWNERILHECYGPMTTARITGANGRIVDLLNVFEYMSFDVGPTLAEWLEVEAPRVYEAMVAADARSLDRHRGHGNAIAAPYHHSILPLASRRDATTEVRWGIADFRRRFGRAPEGMWLPETAVDETTLDVLAAEGIRFTLVAPHQVTGLPHGHTWGICDTPSGRSIAVFAYDGAASHAVAFGNALRDAASWERALVAGTRDPLILATDGETFGHHHTFGEMALASLVRSVRQGSDLRLANCAEILERTTTPPSVSIVPNTSWSCEHGIERWRSACGCRMHPDRVSSQAWRAVLRDSLDWLAGELHAIYEREGAEYFADPWAVRDAFGETAGAGDAAVLQFVRDHTPGRSAAERVRAAELLELERNALRMFTSCGWFFDDIAGLESRQVLRYAARAVELAGSHATRLEVALCDRLKAAESNDAVAGTGDAIYREGKPRIPVPLVAAGGVALAACRAVPVDDVLPPGFGLAEVPSSGDGTIVIRDERTGRTHAVTVTCSPSPETPDTATVSTDDGGAEPWVITPDVLPEPSRTRLTRAICEELVSRHFDKAAMKRLAAGTPLAGVAVDVLRDAIGQLERDPTPPTVRRALDLAHLIASLRTAIPYDVLTDAFRIWQTRRDTVPALAPLARYLRFI
jgi:hypothetical protein